MIYEEFKDLKIIEDNNNPFVTLFEYPTGERFYLEPAFYSQMLGFKEKFASEYQRILCQMKKVVLKNKKVVFTANFDTPQTEVEGYIYLEITDITDPLQIYAEDKSRGSDYGD